jgi:hypothetical protein
MPSHHILTKTTTTVDSRDVLTWITTHPPQGLIHGQRVIASAGQVRELFARSAAFRAWAAQAYAREVGLARLG